MVEEGLVCPLAGDVAGEAAAGQGVGAWGAAVLPGRGASASGPARLGSTWPTGAAATGY